MPGPPVGDDIRGLGKVKNAIYSPTLGLLLIEYVLFIVQVPYDGGMNCLHPPPITSGANCIIVQFCQDSGIPNAAGRV
jgi:hypothetical protein